MSGNGYRFKFQRVLDVREQQKKSLEMELGGVNGRLNDARTHVQQWLDRRAETLHLLREARQRGDLSEAAAASDYLDHVRARLRESGERVEAVRAEREQLRERLEAVMQSCKMLEDYSDSLRRQHELNREKAEERLVELHSAFKFHESKRAQ